MNPKKPSRRLIQNQYFLNENSLAQYIDWVTLARISFVNCNFKKVIWISY